MAGSTVVGSRRSKLVFAGFVYSALIALTAAFLFPLLWVVGLSLKTRLQVSKRHAPQECAPSVCWARIRARRSRVRSLW